ncbi:MAG: hypothetical protein GQ570_04730 [Helicobacteraceae bacterium]|nr:hypothetical protein [Helicobacteraceae bacterium]
MNSFFIEFRDPLFGIIIFFLIIFFISFLSYWWGRFKRYEDHKKLSKFISKFHSVNDEEFEEITKNISQKSLLILAEAYLQSSEYKKSIQVYKLLIERCTVSSVRLEITFALAKTYFKAGFLERAKKLFLIILKESPRSPDVLKYLLLIYEQLKLYSKALEVIEPLEELKVEVTAQKSYIKCMLIINDQTLETAQKVKKLVDIYKKDKLHTHLIFEFLFLHDSSTAWQNLDLSKCEDIIDTLFMLDESKLNSEIISENGYLRELYSAKGYVELAEKSSVFEFDLLIHLKRSNIKSATLMFEYTCNECKESLAFSYGRCPYCHNIDSLKPQLYLTKDHFEKNLSFQ